MRLLALLSLLLAICLAGAARAQSFNGYTAVLEIGGGFSTYEGRVYLTRDTLFARMGPAKGGGYVCPYKGKKTTKSVCKESAVASCSGPFLDLEITGNVLTTNTTTCSGSKPKPGQYCANVQFVEDSQQVRRSYVATGTTTGCLTVLADGSCTFSGEQRIDKGAGRIETYRYRSRTCRMVEGQLL